MIRTLLSILVFFTTSLYVSGQGQQIALDQLVISGSSNINSFKLTFNNNTPSALTYQAAPSGDLLHFKIPVSEIEAGNQMMIADFRHMVNAHHFPFISLTVNRKQFESIVDNSGTGVLNVIVNIAGTSKSYRIPFYKGCLDEQDNFITGSASMSLSDFEIKPLKKFFNLIRLDDTVFINFRINFKQS